MKRDDGLLGAVLAGGRSRRYGRDKAHAVVDGRTLVERAAETLAGVFEDVVVLAGPAARVDSQPAAFPVLADLRQDGAGPLAGIEVALVRAADTGREGAFVLACDLPLVSRDAVEGLLSAWRGAPHGAAPPNDGGAGVIAPASGGFPGFEPLCAIYRTSCLPEVRRLLDADERAAHAVFRCCGGQLVELPAEVFLNVNTPADRDAAERVMRARRG